MATSSDLKTMPRGFSTASVALSMMLAGFVQPLAKTKLAKSLLSLET
jgi:hypothetical protein